jgi:hypothetical protein
VWQALNELLAGRVTPRHLLVAIPGILVLGMFLRLMGRTIQQWDRQVHHARRKSRSSPAPSS